MFEKKIIKQEQNRSGFTIIELLVSVAIIGLMSTVTVGGFIGARKSSDLTMEAQKMATNARRTEGYALAMKSFQGSFQNTNLNNISWGLHFQKGSSTYQIFADKDSDGSYDDSLEKYQDIVMTPGVIISNIYGTSSATSLDIVYTPPDPVIGITENGSVIASGTVEISKDGNVKNIYFNKAGLVDILLSTSTVSDQASFGTMAVLNSNAKKSCNTFCAAQVPANTWKCDSIGTSTTYALTGNKKYVYFKSGQCKVRNTGSCSTIIKNNGTNCFGKQAYWTYCYCSKK